MSRFCLQKIAELQHMFINDSCYNKERNQKSTWDITQKTDRLVGKGTHLFRYTVYLNDNKLLDDQRFWKTAFCQTQI